MGGLAKVARVTGEWVWGLSVFWEALPGVVFGKFGLLESKRRPFGRKGTPFWSDPEDLNSTFVFLSWQRTTRVWNAEEQGWFCSCFYTGGNWGLGRRDGGEERVKTCPPGWRQKKKNVFRENCATGKTKVVLTVHITPQGVYKIVRQTEVSDTQRRIKTHWKYKRKAY